MLSGRRELRAPLLSLSPPGGDEKEEDVQAVREEEEGGGGGGKGRAPSQAMTGVSFVSLSDCGFGKAN